MAIRVENTTNSTINVTGAEVTNILDVTPDELNQCPRQWWGDAGYKDRPRGEDEQNPPDPVYPLPSIALNEPVALEPGEAFVFDYMEIYMIEAAGNYCMSRDLRPVYQVSWQFQQTYGTVAGTVTDTTSDPLANAAITISGTTDEGIVTENVTTTADGTYSSTINFHTDTELTISASADGYIGATDSTTVVEGENAVDLALEQTPIPTGSVSGTLVDNVTGEPVPNATVEITGVDADDNQISETISSNAEGQFSSTLAFQAGTSTSMSITAEGYELT